MKKYLFLVLLILMIFVGCNKNVDNDEVSDLDIEKNTETGNALPDNEQSKIDNYVKKDNSSNTDNIIDDKDIMEIREKMFIAQIEDIYYNFEDFKDKYIKVEGMYSVVEQAEGDAEKIHFVYRNAPGCCGYDGWAGFMLNYDGEYPEKNDWIQVIGTPELVKNGDFNDLYLNVISIEIMDERGAEFVNQ